MLGNLLGIPSPFSTHASMLRLSPNLARARSGAGSGQVRLGARLVACYGCRPTMNYVTPFILFVLGLLLWRQQLSSKRRFEVAEQVLAAFHKASDGLSTLRSPMIWAGEIEAAKPKGGDEPAGDDPPMTKSEEQQRRQRRAEIHNVYVARGETISPAFAELRTAQILAEIHFGRPAADAMGVLFRSRHQVLAAVSGLYSGTFDDRYFPTAELGSITGNSRCRCER